MNITNSLYNLTSVFIRMDRVLLVLLIAFPFSISVSDHVVYEMANKLIKAVGGICVLAWLYAVAYKSNEYLEKRYIRWNLFSVFGIFLLLNVLLDITFLIVQKTTVFQRGNTKITITEPWQLGVAAGVTYLMLLVLVARLLVSAEKGKPIGFSHYWTTILLLIIPPIGVWFVQPRIQNMK